MSMPESGDRIGRTDFAKVAHITRRYDRDRARLAPWALSLLLDLLHNHLKTCPTCRVGMPGKRLGVMCPSLQHLITTTTNVWESVPHTPRARQLTLDGLDHGADIATPSHLY